MRMVLSLYYWPLSNLERIARFDLAFSLWCLQHTFNRRVAKLSRAISHTGDGHLYLLMGLCAYWFESQRGSEFFVTSLVAFAIELPIYWLLKNSVKRKRPAQISAMIPALIVPSDTYSLPSGHTAAAFVMLTSLQFHYPDFAVVALGWAILIGLSRILLGVHFLTDILAGALLGIASASAALYVVVG